MAPDIQEDKEDSLSEELNEIKRKRGYLLPHHGLLSITDPNLLAGYDACYSALTLGKRRLSEKDKEFIWLGILAVTEEKLALQHVTKFIQNGGEARDVIVASQIAAYARGVSSFLFTGRFWKSLVPEIDAEKNYLSGLKNLCTGSSIDNNLLHLALAAIHTSNSGWVPLKWHIKIIYNSKIPETHLAEALSYSMFTGSIPNFIEGCGIWRDMIINKEIEASEKFKIWASLDQEGPS